MQGTKQPETKVKLKQNAKHLQSRKKANDSRRGDAKAKIGNSRERELRERVEREDNKIQCWEVHCVRKKRINDTHTHTQGNSNN